MSIRETAWIEQDGHILRLDLEDGEVSQLLFAEKAGAAEAQSPEMAEALRQLRAYFAGSNEGLSLKLRLRGTEFQMQVWQALLEIPAGQTRSYKQIAERIGRPGAYRAVGQAVHNNPVALIIPCHRVIGSDGSLTGYAGGLDLKEWLLDHEKKFWGGK
ncbi:MAG: methylated-DNA--[protein]-cysteine S-methyltransferase [Candidatus Syntrophosphaera sp.]|nr:methylated-DNA--[protein]-cysteine S-methyltransferase [Candidatus Syntrophosphaera sp.]